MADLGHKPIGQIGCEVEWINVCHAGSIVWDIPQKIVKLEWDGTPVSFSRSLYDQ